MNPAPAQPASWLLDRLDDAQRASLTQIFPAIYEDIHRVALQYMRQERGSHTLTPTALVNGAFVRIHGRGIRVKEQAHALVLAAIAMRHILVEHARGRKREKRGARNWKHSIRRPRNRMAGSDARAALMAELNHSTRELVAIRDRRRAVAR